MTTRELPREEWGKIVETDAGRQVLAAVNPDTTKVVVVEDAEGRVVGSWLVLQVAHVECLWIAPEHRGRGSVLRRLLSGMTRAARALGVRGVVTHAVLPEVEDLLASYGGTAIPGRAWTFPLREEV